MRCQRRKWGNCTLVIVLSVVVAVQAFIIFYYSDNALYMANGRIGSWSGGDQNIPSKRSVISHEQQDGMHINRSSNMAVGSIHNHSPVDDSGEPREVALNATSTSESEEVASKSGTRRKVHKCTCLSNQNDRSFVPNNAGLHWFHIPKTGTSFIMTLWSYAWSRSGRYIDLNVHEAHVHGCGTCYDAALISRYPLEFSHQNLLPSSSTLPVQQGRRGGLSVFSVLDGSHLPQPLGNFLSTNKNMVGFFRETKSRLISGFNDHMHANSFSGESWKALLNRCKDNPLCYATHPGIAGCSTRMINGQRCAIDPITLSGAFQPPSDRQIRNAVHAVKSMGFVGITEEWNESICQFHKIFGGQPQQDQFQNIHRGTSLHSVEELGEGFTDKAEDRVYEAAREVFAQQMGGDSCYELLEEVLMCVPKTCADLKKQCGEWEDGCGQVVVCGMCGGSQRDSLPNTWRFQCVEGQCIRSCPPWDDGGLWFRGSSRSHDKWMSALHDAGAPLESSVRRTKPLEITSNRSAKYVSPTDAINLCGRACSNDAAKSKEFARLYCDCGNFPAQYLGVAPTREEWERVNDLFPSIHPTITKAYGAPLDPTDSQPKCCKPSPDKPHQKWISGPCVDAEYFDSIYLACEAYDKCEELGNERQAHVVVYDSRLHYCHLGRNVTRLIPSQLYLVIPRHHLILV